MRLRLPEPLHGWRSFVGEVGTIVLGVVIALGAGQFVDTIQWQQQVKRANGVFNSELELAAVMAYQRLAVDRCNTARLQGIAAQLNRPSNQWRGMPEKGDGGEFASGLGAVAYRAPESWFPTEGWNTALADGTLDHLPSNRRLALANAYTWIRQLKTEAEREAATQTKLDLLAQDRTLTPEAKLELLQVVSELAWIKQTLYSDSGTALVWIKQADPDFTPTRAHEKKAEIVTYQQGLRGSCVEVPRV